MDIKISFVVYGEHPSHEIAHHLEKLVDKLTDGGPVPDRINIVDVNGNSIGAMVVNQEQEYIGTEH